MIREIPCSCSSIICRSSEDNGLITWPLFHHPRASQVFYMLFSEKITQTKSTAVTDEWTLPDFSAKAVSSVVHKTRLRLIVQDVQVWSGAWDKPVRHIFHFLPASVLFFTCLRSSHVTGYSRCYIRTDQTLYLIHCHLLCWKDGVNMIHCILLKKINKKSSVNFIAMITPDILTACHKGVWPMQQSVTHQNAKKCLEKIESHV